MNDQLEQRIRAAVTTIAEEPAVPPRPAVAVRRTYSWPRRWAPLAAAVCVVLIALIVVIRPGGGMPASTSDSPKLPAHFAGFSTLTAKLSDAPLGMPAIAVVQQGKPNFFRWMSQVIVVGVDGRTYRRVDLAEDRGTDTEGEGDWINAQALISPNGTKLAIGDQRGGATEIPVLDLVTGERRDYALPKPMKYGLWGWSPDGKKIAVVLRDDPARGGALHQRPGTSVLMLLDLADGTFTPVPNMASTPVYGVTFFPSGRLLVTFEAEQRLIDATGYQPVPAKGAVKAWAADESVVVAIGGSLDSPQLQFARASDGQPARSPVPLPNRIVEVLGWRSPEELLVFLYDHETDDDHVLAVVSVTTGEVTTWSTLAGGGFGRAIDVQVAEDLIPLVTLTDASPLRGPWPPTLRYALATLAVLAILIVFRRRILGLFRRVNQ